MDAFTPRNVVKYTVTAIVSTKVSDTAAHLMTDYTALEEDDLVVNIGSKVVGWGVASKLKPYTDKMVDKTADIIDAKRTKRAAKKNPTTE